MQLHGLHHLTAVSADIRTNYRFYTDTLGMRLVKRSVNQDDVSAYHLFYADAVGTPGTDLTFFDFDVPRERRGTRTIARTYLRVRHAGDVAWWAQRLADAGVATSGPSERDGRTVLDFEDPEGQRLALIGDDGAGPEPTPWGASSVPPERQIRGLGPAFLDVPELAPTEAMLTRVLEMRAVRTYPDPELEGGTVHVYDMHEGGAHAEVHVAVRPGRAVARPGAGGVHHVAFRTPDGQEQNAWLERLDRVGLPNSGLVDRYYFQSLYVREPNGILFEIATDGPGFAVDEDPATLGESVVLPPFLEPQREHIVANLKPIE